MNKKLDAILDNSHLADKIQHVRRNKDAPYRIKGGCSMINLLIS